MILNSKALQIDDKVGIRRAGMFESVHAFGTVSKVTAKQLTVTLGDGSTMRFMRNNGVEYGSYAYHPAHLVTVTEANKANAINAPREKRRVTLYKLSDKIKVADEGTFTQKQLDAAMLALSDVNGENS